MTTSEQRVRAKKTRQPEDASSVAGSKARRQRRPTLKEIPSTWTCEGLLGLFETPRGEGQ